MHATPGLRSVAMPVVDIGIVRMAVPYGVVDVPVRVGLARWL